MKWSPQQDKALVAVQDWLRSPYKSQVFRLFGYAGTGKTTLAKHLAASVNGHVMFGAFTGKAALVMRQKGCVGAQTIHSMIYLPAGKSEEKMRKLEAERDSLPEGSMKRKIVEAKINAENQKLKQPGFTINEQSLVKHASLVIIDECSMINEHLAKDLLSFDTKILVLGDPAQLPPVKGAGYFINPDIQPDILLEDIHRQAADNPIIWMATEVRKGKDLAHGDYGNSRVVKEIDDEELFMTDQLLAGRNSTRINTINYMRELMECKDLIEKDEVLVCYKNNKEAGLLNGSFWRVDQVNFINQELVNLDLVSEDGELEHKIRNLDCHTGRFTDPQWDKNVDYRVKRRAHEFCHGYVLTTHKSQGSQWDDVTVLDESLAFRQDASKWLYTAITRAAERVTVIK